jgi:hypothetical protein
MKPERAIFWILTGCLAFVLVLGLGILRRGTPTRPSPAPATASVSATRTPTEPRAPKRTATVRHRLAGTVIGDVRYAVIEDPEGQSDLYRPGETVPGLGRLLEVEADRATFEGEEVRFEIRLAPAPTAPPTPSPLATSGPFGSPSPATSPREPAGTPRGSPPSTVPGRSAS